MKMVDTAVVALAGRRIDLPDAQVPRFPLGNVQEVGQRIYEALCEMHAVALSVRPLAALISLLWSKPSSLVCGDASYCPSRPDDSGKPRSLTVPAAGVRSDDQQVAATAAAGDLLVLDAATGGDAAYAAANEAIVREAQALARTAQPDGPHRLIAILVWEGAPRPGSDATARFRDLTRRAGFEEQSISTLSAIHQQAAGTNSSALT